MTGILFYGNVGNDSRIIDTLVDIAKLPMWGCGDFDIAFDIFDYSDELPVGVTINYRPGACDDKSLITFCDDKDINKIEDKILKANNNDSAVFVDAEHRDFLSSSSFTDIIYYRGFDELKDKVCMVMKDKGC